MDSIHVTNYELNIGLGLRMALVTDMHGMPYHGMPYDDLLMLLQKEGPDAILLSGDTLERHEERVNGAFCQWNSGSFCRR